jgi:hypothetical protein
MPGHKKGPPFERRICRDLSLWVSAGTRDDVFWRSAMSGGRATIGLKSGMVRSAQAGDVTAIHPLGERLLAHVVIDCKDYEKFDFMSGIVKDTGNLRRFWFELVEEAESFGRSPLLVAHQKQYPVICFMPHHIRADLFALSDDHVTAKLPRWGCDLVLLDCFVREARVPSSRVSLKRMARVKLA